MRRSYRGISINTSHNTHETVFDLVDHDKDSVIADIPSGSGAFVARLKDNGYSKIKAIDISNCLDIEHDDFLTGDMTQTLPMEDGSVDTVVCIDGIEHIARQADFVSEVNRILSSSGDFIVSTPNTSSLRSRWSWFTTGHHHKCKAPLDEENPSPMHHIGMISYHELRYLLHTHGFRISEVTTNRIKAGSWFYALFLPLIYVSTWLVYRRFGRKEGTAKINKQVMATMFSKPILFGETLIVKARKVSDTNT